MKVSDSLDIGSLREVLNQIRSNIQSELETEVDVCRAEVENCMEFLDFLDTELTQMDSCADPERVFNLGFIYGSLHQLLSIQDDEEEEEDFDEDDEFSFDDEFDEDELDDFDDFDEEEEYEDEEE